jgi:hypothetical protein
MRRALFEIFAFIVAIASLTLFLSAVAGADPRSGPLGFIAAPLEAITHGVERAVPLVHHRAPRAPSATPAPGDDDAFLRNAAARAAKGPPAGAARQPAVATPPEPAKTMAAVPPPSTMEPAPAPKEPVAPKEPAAPNGPTLASVTSTPEVRADPRRLSDPVRGAAQAMLPWPVASASVYEDLLGYVLWPADYADHLWAHGYGDIMNAMLAPMAGKPEQAAAMIANGMCSAQASALADKLVAHTRAAIVPTAEQQAALDALAATLREAIDRGRTTVCAQAGDPVKQMVDGLWTVWDATLLLRPPLETFYGSLTDAQKAKLAGEAAAAEALARSCADPRKAEWSPDRLAQALGKGQQQRAGLDMLRERSAELIKFLAVSCPQGHEPTPLDRLAAARDRMNAMLYVVMSMSPTVGELYSSRETTSKPSASVH